MSETNIDYRAFVKYVYETFSQEVALEEVEDILHLEEDYNKDSPASLGKGLKLNRLIFSGEKVSGEKFKYDKKLGTGINVWIADNMKGKSTIFKIVKYALTGDEKIKQDVRKWIDEIILEFQIGKAVYTIYIDKTGRDKGSLFTFGLERFFKFRKSQKLDTIEKEREFDFKSKNQFQEKMQKFFFDHFSFYTLKYTQKNSSKEEFELSTANLSWSTYFKSIYLESSNYEYLFFDNETYGAQGRKIFEMILGLPLTYPINMLGIQRDRVSEEIGKLKLADKSKTEGNKNQKKLLEQGHSLVVKKLLELKKNEKIQFNEKPLIEEYDKIQKKVNENRKNARLLNEKYQETQAKVKPQEEEIGNLEYDLRRVESDINRLTKQELNIELYKDAGSFFSNLDITECPHCESIVDDEKRVNEHENHVCSLCGETSTEQKVELGELQDKLIKINEEKSGYVGKAKSLRKNISNQKRDHKNLNTKVEELYLEVAGLPSVELDVKRLKEIETQIDIINKQREEQKDLLLTKEELIKEEAVLKFQLEEIEKGKQTRNSKEIDRLTLKKDILSFALNSLERKRIKLNEDILSKLEGLILDEIHTFGLSSIDKIEINSRYDLIFTQNNVPVNFVDLTEGEKLRVKLAFYLSLIQLDIEHNLGRHPRFLIFDSPGSEEMIEKDLHGLSDVLKNINKRFSNELQIFVGSALREFSQITENDQSDIKGEEEFVF